MSEQITITIRTEYGKQPLRLLHESGQTMLHTMRESGMVLPALCDGIGKCGRCRVRFEGYAPLPTQTERAILEPKLLRQGYRLACMARPVKDCVAECAFAKEADLEIVTSHMMSGVDAEKAGAAAETKRTIIAADIGTTTIAMQLLTVEGGTVLDTYTCMNPQRSYGLDVISRIKAATEGAGAVLQELVRGALRDGIKSLRECVEKLRLQGIDVEMPQLMCIACNTTMGHIFLGYDTSGLGKSPFRPVDLKTAETELEGMSVVVLPGISAFVGGDIVAGLYACGKYELKNSHLPDQPWLFIDLGTNAEMVMGVGKRMVCTAAAAGSAFEKTETDKSTGADRIAAIARLLEKGLVDENGLLAEPYFSDGIEVEVQEQKKENSERKSIWITQEDIRQIQMAKAAVRAGIHFLMKKLGIEEFSQLGRIYVAGGFGFFLDMDAAERIGLLPGVQAHQPKAAGNTALAGAALLGRRMAEAAEPKTELMAICQNAEVFNLAEEPGFEKVYIEYMNFN